MKKILVLILFLPIICYCQNTVRIPTMTKVNEADTLNLNYGYDLFKLEIVPCYIDNYYRITIGCLDSLNKEEVLAQSEVNFQLHVNKKEYKMPDGKFEWDYEATILSNDIIKNDYFTIPDCSRERILNCFIRVLENKRYSVKLFDQNDNYCEFKILNGTAWGW